MPPITPPSPSGWLDIFQGLAPPLQGMFILIAAVVVGILAWNKFASRLNGNEPKTTDIAIGGPTTFIDMSSVKKLLENVDLLTLEMMKSRTATDAVFGQMSKLCDLVGQLLVDLREQREEAELEAARQRGVEEGLRQAREAARRSPSRT